MKWLIRCAACALWLHPSAQAVVVISGVPNTTAPAGQPYFDNVGRVGGASAIYLGDQWVLTAAHVAGALPASASFGGTAYATEAGSFHHLTNPVGSGLTTFTDLVMFRLSVDPGLPAVAIAAGTPVIGTEVMMVGAGRQQVSTPTSWQVTVLLGDQNDVWTELTPPDPNINYTGFKTTPTQVMSWGENQVDANQFAVNYAYGDVVGFTTQFDSGALTNEAQVVSGDSGGAVFSAPGGAWQLAGMLVAAGTFDNQPANTAVVGDVSLALDLTYYRSAILAIVPEPATASLWLLGLLGVLRRRRC